MKMTALSFEASKILFLILVQDNNAYHEVASLESSISNEPIFISGFSVDNAK